MVRSLVSLTCGIMVILSLFMSWWDMEVMISSWTEGISFIDKLSGWDLMSGNELMWVENTGPMFTLGGGILMIACAIGSIVLAKIDYDAEDIFTILSPASRIVAFAAVAGAIWYMMDARGIPGCGGRSLPQSGVGSGPWLAIFAGFVGMFFGISKPSFRPSGHNQDLRYEPSGTPDGPHGPSRYTQNPTSPAQRFAPPVADSSEAQAVARPAAPKSDPAFANYYFGQASQCEENGEYDRAIAAYNKTIGYDPKHTSAYYRRGLLLMSLGRAADALSDLEKVLELTKDYDLTETVNRHIAELKQRLS